MSYCKKCDTKIRWEQNGEDNWVPIDDSLGKHHGEDHRKYCVTNPKIVKQWDQIRKKEAEKLQVGNEEITI